MLITTLLLIRDNHVYDAQYSHCDEINDMTTARRKDRYSTHRNANIVYSYMNDRLDEVIYLFRVPGFHHAKFRREFTALGDLCGQELSLNMHLLFSKYDKSEPEQFDKFKAKLRRFMFNRAGNRNLKITNKNIVQLEKIGEIEGLANLDEIIELLVFYYRNKEGNEFSL